MAVITLTSAYVCGWILPALITQKISPKFELF